MAVSGTLNLSSIGGGLDITKAVTITDEFNIVGQFTVADSVTDQEHTLDLDVSEAKSIYIVSNQAITMEWNDAAGTQGSIILIADEPVLWWSTQKTDGGNTLNPLGTTNITTTFWTNASGSTATVTIKIIYDGSP